MFLIDRLTSKLKLPTSETALPGRDTPIATSETHFVSGRALKPPYPDQMNEVIVGMGCFWGAERLFWEQQGVWITAVGYTAGMTLNPTYNEVCTGLTGHNEVVKIVFDPAEMSFDKVLTLFWEQHDPTQGMRQGNDTGTQYRSGIYTNSEDQRSRATASKSAYNAELAKHGRPAITTEILPAPEFYYAEDYHQQYLAKNPNGYCNLGGVGIACPIAPSN